MEKIKHDLLMYSNVIIKYLSLVIHLNISTKTLIKVKLILNE